MKVVAVVQARLASTRLPGKVLYPALGGRPLLGVLLYRVRHARTVRETRLAVPDRLADRLLLGEWCGEGRYAFAGSEHDVLDRFVQATADLADDDVIVRLTGDNPLVCPATIDSCVRRLRAGKHSYVRTGDSFPEGMDVEVFTRAALLRANADTSPMAREHVTWTLRDEVHLVELPVSWGHLRLTVDEADDYLVVRDVLELLGIDGTLAQIVRLARRVPQLFARNEHIERNTWRRQGLERGDEH